MKNTYYILTIILASLAMVIFFMASFASLDEPVTALVGLIVTAIAAACQVLSLIGLKKCSPVLGIFFEKIGAILLGFAVIVIIAGFKDDNNMLGAVILLIPSAAGGVLCFKKGLRIIGNTVIVKNREWTTYVGKLCEKMPHLKSTLREGATMESIKAAETKMGCQFPELLKGLYLTNDGDDARAVCGMLLGFHFLSLSSVTFEWQRSYSDTKWVPIGSDGGGNFIGVDLEPGATGRPGQVISFGRDEQGKTVIAEDLGKLFDRFTRIVCSKDFYIGEYNDEKVILLGTDDVENGSYMTDYLRSAGSVK